MWLLILYYVVGYLSVLPLLQGMLSIFGKALSRGLLSWNVVTQSLSLKFLPDLSSSDYIRILSPKWQQLNKE